MTEQPTRRARVAAAVSPTRLSPTRLTPEHTRRATLFERRTVRRMGQDRLLIVHGWLEFLGKFTFGLYCAAIATIVLGADWKHTIASTLNDGRPLKGAIVLVFVVPTLVFLLLRSAIGYLRWRVQRELWRRDVERLTAAPPRG